MEHASFPTKITNDTEQVKLHSQCQAVPLYTYN